MDIPRFWKQSALVLATGLYMALVLAPSALGAAITQSYIGPADLAAGSLVVIKDSDRTEVESATLARVDDLLGVAVAPDEATLAVTNRGAGVQVATSGTVSTFVSDVAGKILPGDRITASPIAGVGMKATDSTKVIGVAEQAFDGGAASKTVTLTSKDGKQQQFKVGAIPVQLQVAYYVAQDKSAVPPFLQQFSNSVAGKAVALPRIIVSFLVLVAAILTIAVILFSAVRSSMISVGRNPLAQAEIYRGLIRVILVSVGILLVATGGVYLILRI